MTIEDIGENVVDLGTARARGPRRSLPRTPLEPWEEELLFKLILDRKTNKRTGEETVTIRGIPANVATILQHHPLWAGVVALNVFHLRIEAKRVPPWHPLDMPSQPKPGPWGEGDTARLANWFARTSICGMPPLIVGAKTIDPAVIVAAESNSYHPVKDYLRGVEWDGDARLDTWVANYLGGELTPYACAVGRAFLIGCVARIMRPGCKLDTCLVLEGGQGKYKSTALEILAGEWFADSKLAIGEKDGMQGLAGVWIYELGELASFGKADVETIKAFMSSRSDHYRPSYGKYTLDVPRQVAFAGTTNAGQYMQDETGGRRFNPLRTGTIDVEALRRDRDQIWAEAVKLFDAGEKWWIDDVLTAPEQEDRYVADEWQSRIATYLRLRTSTTVGDILEDLIYREVDKNGDAKNNLGRWGQREQSRVARCLTGLGWVRRRRSTGARDWHYVPPRLSPAADTGTEKRS